MPMNKPAWFAHARPRAPGEGHTYPCRNRYDFSENQQLQASSFHRCGDYRRDGRRPRAEGTTRKYRKTSTPTDTVTTTQPLVPGTTTSVLGPEAPTEEDPPGDSGAPSETTMTDDDESSVIEDAGDVLVDEPATDDADTPSEETEPAVIPEPSDDPSESGDDTEGTLDTQPESGSETEPVSEPEQPEAAPEATEIDTIVCVRDADDTLICPEVVPDDYSCENIDGDLLCRSSGDESEPEPAPETGQPAPDPEQPEVVTEESITCERGTDGVLACPEVVPADYWCENVDNDLVCHPPSTAPDPEPTQSQTVDWTPPVAGMVPETHPDAPLREWERGPVNPDARANDYPRLTNQTLAWADWCSGVFSSCRWLMHEMHQALDYLGANPRCVLNIYTQKVNHYLEQGSGVNASYAANNFGWHLCASVIDPIVRDLPTDDLPQMSGSVSPTCRGSPSQIDVALFSQMCSPIFNWKRAGGARLHRLNSGVTAMPGPRGSWQIR